jgi:hypothetical protein
VAEWMHKQGGKAHVGMRRADLGCSASRAHEQVRRLVASGVLTATPGLRGTFLELMGSTTELTAPYVGFGGQGVTAASAGSARAPKQSC